MDVLRDEDATNTCRPPCRGKFVEISDAREFVYLIENELLAAISRERLVNSIFEEEAPEAPCVAILAHIVEDDSSPICFETLLERNAIEVAIKYVRRQQRLNLARHRGERCQPTAAVQRF